MDPHYDQGRCDNAVDPQRTGFRTENATQDSHHQSPDGDHETRSLHHDSGAVSSDVAPGPLHHGLGFSVEHDGPDDQPADHRDAVRLSNRSRAAQGLLRA